MHAGNSRTGLILLAFMVTSLAYGWGPAGELRAATPQRPVVGYFIHDDPLAWQTLETYGNRLAWVITTNFYISDATGSLRGTHDARAMALARSRGASVHFRVSNLVRGDFDRDLAHAIVANAATRDRAIADVRAAVDTYGYDGVHFNVEQIPPGDRGMLTGFMRELGAGLRSRGKTLSIAVPAKTGDNPSYPSSGAFDLAALGALADWVIIMAYDEHWDTGPPGPVASLPWVEAVVRYTATVVAPAKSLLGVALYGYDWPRGGAAEGISMREAVRRAAQAGVPILWDEGAKVPYYRVGDRTVYFENARSLGYKLAIREQAGLAGIATWRLGHELPDVWETIGRDLTGSGQSNP